MTDLDTRIAHLELFAKAAQTQSLKHSYCVQLVRAKDERGDYKHIDGRLPEELVEALARNMAQCS